MPKTSLLALVLLAPLAQGCAAGAASPKTSLAEVEPFDYCEQPISLDEVARRASLADAVFVGEMHDHPMGLTVEAALFEKIAARAPTAALSLEFLERDTQPAVDDYLAGKIDQTAFLLKSRLNPHESKPGHLAMIETAKRLGLPVVAANAPRSYAKKARTEGYAALDHLPDDERALFVVPRTMPGRRYELAFDRIMGGHEGPSGGADAHMAGFFRAQALWDATMADSVAKEVDGGRHPVVHVVGRFHVDDRGGTVELFERSHPKAKVFVVTIVEDKSEIGPDLADAVVVVGPAPERSPH